MEMRMGGLEIKDVYSWTRRLQATNSSLNRKKLRDCSEMSSECYANVKGALGPSRVYVRRTKSSREPRRTSESPVGWSASSGASCRLKQSASFRDGLGQGEHYRVLMLGASGVGKTALVQQFQQLKLNNVNMRITNIYEENFQRSCDVQLTIIDNPSMKISATMAISCCDVDAYIVVYSITEWKSFEAAKETIKAIQDEDDYGKKAAILVGNKADLVRKRVVSIEEGKALATSRGCKFIETSNWIDHDLFDGVLAQMRLRIHSINDGCNSSKDPKKLKRKCRRYKTLQSKPSWNILKDLFHTINHNVKKCDNLQVL